MGYLRIRGLPSMASSYPFKYSGRGSVLYIDGHGRMEVTPGSEAFVQKVMSTYLNVCSVKIERPPDLHNSSTLNQTKRPKRPKLTPRTSST